MASRTLGHGMAALLMACGGLATGSCGNSSAGDGSGFGAGNVLDASLSTGDDSAPIGDDGSLPLPTDDGPGLFTNPEGGACRPKTCQQLGYTCGQNDDGCGGVVDCGTCKAPNVCGGGGYSQCGFVAGDAACVGKTCKTLGYGCGPAGDGCGGLLQCGSCASPDICGGGGLPGVCGHGSSCAGLCAQQVACDGGTPTTVTGRVVAGTLPQYGMPDPVPNVLVYVPNAPLQPFSKGVQCNPCGADVSGGPITWTATAFDGTFSLPNVPVGKGIPLVIQLGRWRRKVFFDVTAACASTAVGDIRMPRNKGDGDVPLTAISTGNADAIECVLLKMGVDQAEFTASSGSGRVHLYSGNGANAANPNEAALLDTGGTYMNYDQILLPCWGLPAAKTSTELANLVSYGNGGGHFFATHFSYTWLAQNNPFSQTAQWNVNYNVGLNSIVGNVDVVNNPKGPVFSKWLNLVGALSSVNPPRVTIATPRHDVNAVNPGAIDWIDGTDPDGTPMLLHYTFDLPWGIKEQCGHAIFSDFHVNNPALTFAPTFPNECDANPMTPQEKVLEFMIWDLGHCVPPPSPPTCAPITCQKQSLACGPAGDGCGNTLNCGTCTPPLTCGGGGVPGQCGGGGTCTPKTCAQKSIACGQAGDGCGNILNCGTCVYPQTCGGGGVAGQCGGSPAN